jgi:hypothetical protein
VEPITVNEALKSSGILKLPPIFDESNKPFILKTKLVPFHIIDNK